MPFPEEEDRRLQHRAGDLLHFVNRLSDWVGEFADDREGVWAISDSDRFELLDLRRLARGLHASAHVPVAAAVYGPSQVGKSLFVGRVLEPSNAEKTALGYEQEGGGKPNGLSFQKDLNPGKTGSYEATALVTRFTTKDRLRKTVSRDCPVIVRALNRAQWLCVLARGFQVECLVPDDTWDRAALEQELVRLSEDYRAGSDDPRWRSDLLDAYMYIRKINRHLFKARDDEVNGLLCRYPLTDEGYSKFAARVFWNGLTDEFRMITEAFNEVCAFINRLDAKPATDGRARRVDLDDRFVMTDWRAVRFLLDSQRKPDYETDNFGTVAWRDFQLEEREEFAGRALAYRKGQGTRDEPLSTFQAAMLEMVVPVDPDHLNDDWRDVLFSMDLLDIPGLRAGRAGADEGKREAVEKDEEVMEIIKRGKVAYLFEGYTDEKQIQTLLFLVRGGNIESAGFMKAHVERWGRSRYEDKWPLKVTDDPPPLFLGMTGFDEEFRDRKDAYADAGLYDTRLSNLIDALSPLLDNFGGNNKKFRNLYVIRYPGTWDASQTQREEAEKPERWDRAQQAFLESSMVQEYVANAKDKLSAAMDDSDGGLTMICANFRKCTEAGAKRDQLRKGIEAGLQRAVLLSKPWVADDDVNKRRQKRRDLAHRVLTWLTEKSHFTSYRTDALQKTLSVKEGDVIVIADLADITGDTMIKQERDLSARLDEELKGFLSKWSKDAIRRWGHHVEEQKELMEQRERSPGEVEEALALDTFTEEVFALLTEYLHHYLLYEEVFEGLMDKTLNVLKMRVHDEAAMVAARRSYVRLILNDYVLNPGSGIGPLEPETEPSGDGYGMMSEFVRRWQTRLPAALATGAGQAIVIPAGNEKLKELLTDAPA